ncbi:MAG TPA: SIMPL domain-containing protein [Streptosporangiaceae bacterium]|nr:SIMPL domain-containing protein [Streptosporangiaceae bacterium]
MNDSGDTPSTSPATVTVRGEATIETDPEIVVFAVSVQARARDRREATENLARRSAEFTTLVKSFGDAIEKAETSRVSVYPELRRGRDERVRWYRGAVRSTLTVADFSIAGELVAKISDLELCLIDGPWWQLRPGSAVYHDARTQAARAAVSRAAEYAEAVGGRLLTLIELADTGLATPSHPPLRYAASRAMPSAAASEETPVVIDLEPETQVVTATVEARFTMTQPSSLG